MILKKNKLRFFITSILNINTVFITHQLNRIFIALTKNCSRDFLTSFTGAML